MSETAASAIDGPNPSFPQAVRLKLPTPFLQTLSRIRWIDRLVSLWAPVTVLALLFLVYLTIVETAVCSYLWLQPVMQAIGVLCFGWWALLVISRLTLRSWNARRSARYHSEELLAEIESVVTKNRKALTTHEWDQLTSGVSRVLTTYGKSAPELSTEVAKLREQAQATLSRFQRGGALGLTSGFVRALMVALLFRAALIEPYKIPSGSMIPTLEIGDQIFVNKFIYGIRIPFTNYVPFVLVRPPQRGDIVVFNNPIHTEVDYIKRIIGIPGDRIEFTKDEVLINGTPLAKRLENADYVYADQPRPSIGLDREAVRRWFIDDWNDVHEVLYRETIDGKPHSILEDPQMRQYRMASMLETEIVVPENSVFVMGDNRNHSEDSRFGLGSGSNRPEFVPFGNIKGKATVIWLSLARGGLFQNIFGGTGIRYDRFFRPVTMCASEPPRS